MTLQQQIRSARTRTLVVMILFFVLMAVIVAGVYVFFGSGFGLLMLLVAIGYGFFGYIAAGSVAAAAINPPVAAWISTGRSFVNTVSPCAITALR